MNMFIRSVYLYMALLFRVLKQRISWKRIHMRIRCRIQNAESAGRRAEADRSLPADGVRVE